MTVSDGFTQPAPEGSLKSEDPPTSEAGIAIGFGLAGLFVGILLGSMIGKTSSSDMSDTGLRWMGEAIGEGIAEAACIESRGDWGSSGCEFEK